MRIDLPIVIVFDCQDTDFRSVERAVGRITCTLRYETEGDGRDAELLQGYPPSDPALGEPAQALLAFLPSGMDKKIKQRAARSPYDYLHGGVDEADRVAAQEEVDEQRRQDSQFGAGA